MDPHIPRKETRANLGSRGLVGKVRLSTDMSQEEILSEIRSVFSEAMNNNTNFPTTQTFRSLSYREVALEATRHHYLVLTQRRSDRGGRTSLELSLIMTDIPDQIASTK